jgi:hypothetical protein
MGTLNLLFSAKSPLPHMQVNPRLHTLLFCWFQEASLSTGQSGSVLTTKASCWRAPTALWKRGNPVLPLSGKLPFCGCQETWFPKAQKSSVFPTVPNHRRAPASLLKTKNARFATEEGKEVTYAMNGTRRPVFWGAQRPRATHSVWQLESPHFLAGESLLSCLRDGIPDLLLSGNLLFCKC